MTQQHQRRFPTLHSPKHCSPPKLCQSSRDTTSCSPPTLPYSLESVVMNMSHGGVTTSGSTSSDDEVNIFQSSPNSAESSNTLNIFNSPSSHSKANKGATSPGKRVGQFFCNGTYGKPGATGTGSNTATQVPLEDVMRWKEFRRRQKELQDENLEVQIDAPTKSESLGMPCSSSDERQSSNDVKEVIDPLGFPSKELTVENVERGAAAEALTEIASNTMFSRLVANSEGSKKMGASVCETLLSETQKPGSLWNKKRDLRVNTSPATPISACTPSAADLSNMSALSDSRERFGETKKTYGVHTEWDDTRPTLEIDALNECKEENNNDVSTLSSNWDPSVIEELDENDDQSLQLDRTNIHGDMNDSFVGGSSNSLEAPTLMEVKSFMKRLDSLREEQQIIRSNISNGMSSFHSPPNVEINVEHVEDSYFQSLLEKKEKLRLHKLESQRKRNELDERLKILRNKLQSPSARLRDDGESTDGSMMALGSPAAMMTGARWSGGRAIWKSPVSSPQVLSDNNHKKLEDTNEQISCMPEENLMAATSSPKSPLREVAKSMTSTDKGFENIVSDKAAQDVVSPTPNLSHIGTKDDFSFTSAVPSKQIPFSPMMSTSQASSSKFTFAAPDVNRPSKAMSARDGALTASASSSLYPPISPDVSEGDKGGGLGFGYIFDNKSVESKTSSKFVELGHDQPKGEVDDEMVLVGVTVKGSKYTRQKNSKLDSPCARGISSSTILENVQSPLNVAPDPPGVESTEVWKEEMSAKVVKKPLASEDVPVKNSCLSINSSNTSTNVNPPTKDVTSTKDFSTKQSTLSISPPPLSPVVESISSDSDFEATIQKAKTISNTPRNCITPKSCLETPKAANTASLKSPRFRAERESKISALKSKFESNGLVSSSSKDPQWTKTTLSSKTLGMRWSLDTASSVMNAEKEFFESMTPITGFVPHLKVTQPSPDLAPTLSNIEELTQNDSLDSSISSFKGLRIQELRSRFENGESLSVESKSRKKCSRSLMGNRCSLENDASENGLTKVDAEVNSPSVGHNCIDDNGDDNNHCTNSHSREKSSYEFSHLLSKAKNLEKKNNRAQFQQAEEAKENIVDHSADGDFPNFSPSAVRKKAFEMRKQQARIRTSTPKNNQNSSVLLSKPSNVAAGQHDVLPVSSMAQSSTPRLSVRERVASFNNPDGFQGIPQNPHQTVPLQKFTPPPSSIQMSYTNQTPSKFSPMETFISPNRRMQSATSPYKKHYNNNHGIYPQGSRNNYHPPPSLDSPGDSDDYEDGITLSPTCSEVSGLTLPTCLGGFEEKPKKKSNTLDAQDCMSPIARHRQIKGVHSSGTLFNHPYLKRMMSPKASGQERQQSSSTEVKTQSHRQQIISRVVEKPSSRKSQGAPNEKPLIKKSPSNQSTLTTAPSNVSEVLPNSKQKPGRMGKVAEKVAMLSEQASNRHSLGGNTNQISTRGAKEAKASHSKRLTIEEQSSTATKDCVRLN